MYSPPITKLINAFKKLPTVGTRTAERFVFYLLKSGKKEVSEMIEALDELLENVKSCEECWDFSDKNPCVICSDPKRDHTTICVVADSQDVAAIERTHEYKGMYHVLRGLLDATDIEHIHRLKIRELKQRAVKNGVHEIILAFSPDVAGETTALFLEKELRALNPRLAISRLARGLPMGSDLRYADEITLASAIQNRLQKKSGP